MKSAIPLFTLLLFFCTAVFITACKQTSSQSETTESAETDQMMDDEIITELGLLKNVEDAGYPMAVLTIEFPERKFEESFLLNLEAVEGTDNAMLSGLVGKYVSFEYTSKLENALMELQMNNKSLLGGEKFTPEEDTKEITGILGGVASATGGDLPDEITITTDEDNTLTFKFFITPEMVAANGKKVTGFYTERTENNIVSIKASKE